MLSAVKDNQDIFSLAVELYGSPSYAFKIAKDNQISINNSLTGKIVQYDETIKKTVLEPFIIKATDKNIVQKYTAISNQSIFDISLMTIGTIEGIVGLIKSSTIESINSDIQTGDEFNYNETSNDVKKYINLTGRVFASKS